MKQEGTVRAVCPCRPCTLEKAKGNKQGMWGVILLCPCQTQQP